MNSSQGKIFISPHDLNPIVWGALTSFDDHVLAPLAKTEVTFDEAAYLILLPVTGDLFFQSTDNESAPVEVGEIKIYSMPADSTIQITNPYESASINFIQLTIRDKPVTPYLPHRAVQPVSETLSFDLNTSKNELIEIYSAPGAQTSEEAFCVFIGQFDGRSETIYQVKHQDAGVFVYIIAGAFEVEGRLLHAKDGLVLWDMENVELEALSENAVVLFMEL